MNETITTVINLNILKGLQLCEELCSSIFLNIFAEFRKLLTFLKFPNFTSVDFDACIYFFIT